MSPQFHPVARMGLVYLGACVFHWSTTCLSLLFVPMADVDGARAAGSAVPEVDLAVGAGRAVPDVTLVDSGASKKTYVVGRGC